VNEPEPFEPFVKVKPVSDPSVTVPFETEIVKESGPPLEDRSVTLIWFPLADINVSEEFSVALAVEGALIAGRKNTFQVKPWLALAPWPSLAVTDAE
jgi:hypothetical protein